MIFLMVICAIFFHMCLIWGWYIYQKNPSVVDVGWASGLILVSLVYLYNSAISPRTMTLSCVLLLWGFRLGFYLWYTRIRHGIIDKRYVTLSENWKLAKPLGFFFNFQLQGLLILLISLPWYFVAKSNQQHMSSLDWAILFLAVIAIIGETCADHQLMRFKKHHAGAVCNQGLWFYSRHPNYFFEWLTWCFFYMFALLTPLGWMGFISPLTLYVIMTRITGPMTEAGSMKSKGPLYLAYQQSTPMFFPKLWRYK